MKDFDYYKTNPHKYPNRFEYKKKLIDEIDNTPLTKDQRKAELDKVDERTREWFKEAVMPHNAEASRLESEFWQDCRAELEYSSYLDETGMGIIEHWAYEDGHAYGFSQVFSELEKLDEFLTKIKGHIIS